MLWANLQNFRSGPTSYLSGPSRISVRDFSNREGVVKSEISSKYKHYANQLGCLLTSVSVKNSMMSTLFGELTASMTQTSGLMEKIGKCSNQISILYEQFNQIKGFERLPTENQQLYSSIGTSFSEWSEVTRRQQYTFESQINHLVKANQLEIEAMQDVNYYLHSLIISYCRPGTRQLQTTLNLTATLKRRSFLCTSLAIAKLGGSRRSSTLLQRSRTS